MHVTRLADARPYDAKNHHNMMGLQLQGNGASASEIMTCGLSYFLPGGGATMSPSVAERIYIVVEGEIVLIGRDAEHVMNPLDSCWIPAGEERAIENRSNKPATMIVMIAKRS